LLIGGFFLLGFFCFVFVLTDTIITWNVPLSRVDLALSFAEPTGCQSIWEQLCAARGVDPDEAGFAEEAARQTYQHQPLPKMEPDLLPQVQGSLSYSPPHRLGMAETRFWKPDFIWHFLKLMNGFERTSIVIILNVSRAFHSHLLSMFSGLQIVEFFSNLSPFMCESVAATIIAENYLDQLIAVFTSLEAAK
jgi:hypothetical protein